MLDYSVLATFRAKLEADGRSFPMHIQQSLDNASLEHVSGISLAQLETPMMKQFKQAKDEVPDALLFFRMGDFYELFGTDAVVASDVCGLTLTSRDKNSSQPVPMAGIPVCSYQNTLRKCVKAGFKVAICEQVEDPKLTKTLVRREIVRIATPACPGDLGLDEELSKSEGCYLVSVIGKKDLFTFGCVDASIGNFAIASALSRELLEEEILSRRPKEVLCSSEDFAWLHAFCRTRMNPVPRVSLHETWIARSPKECEALVKEFFSEQTPEKLGLASVQSGLQVVASLLSYLKATQKSVLKNINHIEFYSTLCNLFLDDATKKHLDFFQTSEGERKGSLYWFMNRCSTNMGSRLLYRRLNAPMKDENSLILWHQSVEDLVKKAETRKSILTKLSGFTDFDRAVSKAAQGALDPRSLGELRNSLCSLPLIQSILKNEQLFAQNVLIDFDIDCLSAIELTSHLTSALEDILPMSIGKEERVIKEGYSVELDEHYNLTNGLKAQLDKLEQFERERSGISTLKIGYTKVFGYYFEVSKGKLSQVPDHFVRKQTLTNGERYITAELKELEDKSLASAEQLDTLESFLFNEICDQVVLHSKPLAKLNAHIATLDLIISFASVSAEHAWCVPHISALPQLELKNSVHPVLATGLGSSEEFVSNDVKMDCEKGFLFLLTGPNMAGKSTLMRQVAITQILMQMGCCVPATFANIGIADKIFTRIGSGDAALKGQSTFMVEMLETASILRNATSQSLIFMDEIGRGTSTYDGMSLAWAILEDLHDRIGARTFFSTHYHELQGAVAGRKGIVPMQMQVVEVDRVNEEGDKKREILFTRKIIPGASGRSFGFHVAAMAGVSNKVVERAQSVMEGFLGGGFMGRRSGAMSKSSPNAESNSPKKWLQADTRPNEKASDKPPETGQTTLF
jgi:DNA mismatch repair protein MutS